MFSRLCKKNVASGNRDKRKSQESCRYLEDLATVTGHMGQIKLIEGLIVAAETLGGEVIFFSLSGNEFSTIQVQADRWEKLTFFINRTINYLQARY